MNRFNELEEKLNLSVHALNCLKRAGITTIEELVNTPQSSLIRIRNMGKKTLEEINREVDKYMEEHPAFINDEGNEFLKAWNELEGSDAWKQFVEVAGKYGLFPYISTMRKADSK